ncbi:hypothetical protein B4100_3303 [Heyndrickxia coagulans]|nr:hypothetical protein B4100_3303 [Heyndrickxia coagulans]
MNAFSFYNKSIRVSFRYVKTKFPNGGFSVFLFVRVWQNAGNIRRKFYRKVGGQHG